MPGKRAKQDRTGTGGAAGHILPMAIETVPMDAVEPFPGNARRGDRQLIATSLTELGQYKPVIVQRSTGHILVGNNTYLAARAQGWQEIAAQYIDVDDQRAREINLIDNRASDLADYDDKLLLKQLQDLPELAVTGYGEEDREALLRATDAVGDPATAFLAPFMAPPPASPAAAAGAAPDTAAHGVSSAPEPSGAASDMGDDTKEQVPAATPAAAAEPHQLYVPVSWTVTVAERDEIRAGLRTAQGHWQLSTTSEALLAVIRFFTQRQE